MNQLTATTAHQDDSILSGMLGSLLLHLCLLALLFSVQVKTPIEAAPPPLLLKIRQPETKKIARKQIVTTPKLKPEDHAPENTHLLSDINARTETETIKRGDDPEAGPVKGSSPPAATSQTKRPVQKSARAEPPAKSSGGKKLQTLTLDSATSIAQFGGSPQKSDHAANTLEEVRGQEGFPLSYQAFSRAPGSGARFLGQTGSADYLPHLPDGDITLLNTKADKYAVFVRRVASRVFGELRASGWEQLSVNDIRNLRGFSTVRAVLSLKGELLHVHITESSGSDRFDRVLQSAVSRGARDPNPPADAATSDGTIHFIFKSRSWVRFLGDRNSGISQRRWLLLGTGLE